MVIWYLAGELGLLDLPAAVDSEKAALGLECKGDADFRLG